MASLQIEIPGAIPVKSRDLILFSFFFTFSLNRVNSNLFVVLLQGSQIFTGLRELTFLHALTDVPVHESSLGIHQVELVIETSPSLGNGSGVAQHAHGTLNLGKVTTWNHSWWLVVDANLEASGAPVHELDGALGLDGCNGSIDILWHDITSVQHAAGHVLSMTRITFYHLVGRLKAGIGDLGHGQLLMVGLLSRDDGSISGQREVDARVGHQVGLELSQVHVQGAIKTQGSSDGAHDLPNQAIQVGVGRALDVQVTTTNVVNGFIVHHESTVRMLQSGVSGEDGVVWLDHGGRDLWSRVDSKLQLGFLSIVNTQSLHEKRSESRTSSTTKAVENEESL